MIETSCRRPEPLPLGTGEAVFVVRTILPPSDHAKNKCIQMGMHFVKPFDETNHQAARPILIFPSS
jgi:hypothetical protein